MILYSRSCLACTNKLLWRKLKAFAAENNLPIEERRVTRKKEWQQEAESYGISPPFAVNGKIAISLSEDLKKLL